MLAAVGALLALAHRQSPFREISDGAVLELYTLQALRGRLLVGPYSRFGWHHPGPLYFYLQAPLYWLSGFHTAGMQTGALVVNVGAVAVIAWATASFVRPAVAIAVMIAAASFCVRSGDFVVSPWNPHVIVLPLAAFIVVAAAFAATGRRAFVLWLVPLGSFVVQTHLATVPVVAALGLAGASSQPRSVRQGSGGLMMLAIVLWLPALIEQVTRSPGNITKLWAFFASGPPARTAGAAAAAAWSSALVAPLAPDFVVARGYDFSPPLSWPLGIALVEVGGCIAAAALLRRRDRSAAWLSAMCAAASMVALIAATRIGHQIVDHEVFWMAALGSLNAGTLAGIVAGLVIDRIRPEIRGMLGRAAEGMVFRVGTVSIVLVSLVGLGEFRRTLHRARGIDDHAVDVLVEQFERAVSTPRARRPLIHVEHQVWPIAAGALLQLHKAHIPFAVDENWVAMFGEAFAADGREDADVTFAGSRLAPLVVRRR